METTNLQFTIGNDTSRCLNLIATLKKVMDEAKDMDKRLEANLYIEIEQHFLGAINELMNLASLSISNAMYERKTEI